MSGFRALEHPLVGRLVQAGLDISDIVPLASRRRRPRLDLDATNAPEIFDPPNQDDRMIAWTQLEAASREGLLDLAFRVPERKSPFRELRRPYVSFAWSERLEDDLRETLERPRRRSVAALWRAAVLARTDLDPATALVISSMPLAVRDLTAEETLSRLLSIRDVPTDRGIMLREVSSRLFEGLSKVLDGRQALVRAILGATASPFPDLPVMLSVDLDTRPEGILFVENSVSFLRAMDAQARVGLGLVESRGFRASAHRIRRPEGRIVFYSPRSLQDEAWVRSFEDLLDSGAGGHAFWGDLDFSGMAILATLRTSFPGLTAWRPGYGPMLDRLLSGGGHAPSQAGKENQRDPGTTGCSYADDVLLPAIRREGRFVDQE